ncbi:polysaccharide biosynthesis tyrosine autokinase [Akkermansia sp.]|uniref:polysaccharide biosynthesis tyrosine autokinase n=2 Tax=Akkermansia sp. TaxID=1872421 RepID=UPI0025BAF521|nr:polysaccharide biosynthesis tyrosine autokinase [Akkermansia sp.]
MVNRPSPSPPVMEEEESNLSLDLALAILRRYWFIIMLAAVAGGMLAFYLAGRQNYVYQKTASIIMRDAKSGTDASSDRIMSELGIDSGAVNLANESFILKSTAVMKKVVEDLKLNTSYWYSQDFRKIELYNSSPILAVFEEIGKQRSCSFSITPRGEQNFILAYTTSQKKTTTLEGTYGQSIALPFATVSIHPTSLMNEEWDGKPIIINHLTVLETAHGLLKNFSVTRPDVKESSLLEMTLTANNPQKAADVLNQLIAVYNQVSIDEKKLAAQKTKKFIEGRLEELEKSLNKAGKELTDFKTKNDIAGNAETTISADFSSAQALEKEIFDLETQIKLAAVLADNLKKTVRNDGLISVDTGLADNGISRQIEGYNEAFLEYQKIAGSAGSQNPIAVGLRERMDSTLSAANKALANYRSNQNLKLEELKKKRETLSERLTKTATKEQEFTPLIREHKVKEELYLNLLSKEQENAMALAAAESSARVLETAHGSDLPIAPKTEQYIAAGTLGGAALCFFAFLGLGMMNNKVKNKHDLTGQTRQPIIAELPRMSKKERKNTSLFIKEEQSVMAECFHILRNNVDSLLPRPDEGGHVIMLTSTTPGEGKTFTSANLAATFAKAGRKVLLIDGDLRKFSLTRQMGGHGRRGLTSILLNQVDDPFHIIRQAGENNTPFDFLGTGPAAPNPVTLLSQPLLAQILECFRKKYDAVIIDTPPYGILADTAILAALSDISLYLIRSGMIDKRYFNQIQKLADSGKLPNLAYIINAVDFKSSSYSYYGYNYGYRYSYGSGREAAGKN